MKETGKVQPIGTTSASAIFIADRHPDTIDIVGPYEVQLQQIAGAKITSGEVIFSIQDRKGQVLQEGQAPLQSASETKTWKAVIPGAPVGAQITYYFRPITADEESIRYPANEAANFRFRIVPLAAVSVDVPNPESTQESQQLSIQVRALAAPSGEAIVRRLSTSLESLEEEHISLEVISEPQNTYKLAGNFPPLKPGEIADFYFHLVAPDGTEQNIPADAPARVYSIKRPLRPVQYFPIEEAFVLDVSFSGEDRWIGLKDGGAWLHSADGKQEHWGLEVGLPSGVARFVLPDPPLGRVYIGSDRGVGFVEAGEVFVHLTKIHASAWDTQAAPNRLMNIHRAGPGVLSPLDGTLFFQLQGEGQLEQSFPPAIFFEFRDDQLSEWQPPPLNPPLVGISTGSFDLTSGCSLFGGLAKVDETSLRPTLVVRCGPSVEQILLKNFTIVEREATPTRVISLDRDPDSGGIVAAIEYMLLTDPNRKAKYGVYLVDPDTGSLSLMAEELSAIETEITALTTDWPGGRLLVGTFGEGIWQIISGHARRLDLGDGYPNEITSLEVDPKSSKMLIGTSSGAFEISVEGHLSSIYTTPIGEALPSDGLPMDIEPHHGRVLISSYRGGLAEIARQPRESQQIIRLRPGKELPAGLFGDAQYAQAGAILAVVHSQGLLRVDGGRTSIIGPNEGLFSQELLRLLVLSSDHVWLAFTPQPFSLNAALQLLADGEIERTVELQDRDTATIGDWIEVPQRNTVFAATRAGTIEISLEGSIERISVNPVSAIARNAEGSIIGIVGTTIERWDGNRFVPVLFQVDHPRLPHNTFYLSAAIDIAINEEGEWFVLFKDGILVLLDSQGLPLGLMDNEDGIPASSGKLLMHPLTGELFVGGHEGLVMISPAYFP